MDDPRFHDRFQIYRRLRDGESLSMIKGENKEEEEEVDRLVAKISTLYADFKRWDMTADPAGFMQRARALLADKTGDGAFPSTPAVETAHSQHDQADQGQHDEHGHSQHVELEEVTALEGPTQDQPVSLENGDDASSPIV